MQFRRTDITEATYFFTANPVKRGYIAKTSEWPYSSIHRCIKSGMIDEDWGADKMIIKDGGYGEL